MELAGRVKGELIRRLGMTIITRAVLAYIVVTSVSSMWLQGKTNDHFMVAGRAVIAAVVRSAITGFARERSVLLALLNTMPYSNADDSDKQLHFMRI